MGVALAVVLITVVPTTREDTESEPIRLEPSTAVLEATLNGDLSAVALDLNPFDAGAGRGWTARSFYLSGTVGSSRGPIITAHAGAGYEFREDITVNVELLSGAVNNDDSKKAGAVFGLDLLLRWHLLKGDGWTVYLDGGAGFQLATTDYPSDSFWNFRLMIGPGATWQVTEQIQLMGGVRYLHISNAYTTNINEGLDAAQLYFGLMVPF